MTKANIILQCAVSSKSANHDGHCKTNQFPCSSREAHYRPLEGNMMEGDENHDCWIQSQNLISTIFNFQTLVSLKFGHSYVNS